MLTALLMVAASAAGGGAPAPAWTCTNSVEVWCGAEDCTVRPPEETTPLSVSLGPGAAFSVCAYSGCWEGTGRLSRRDGRVLLTADGVPFSSGAATGGADITLLITGGDGAGFVRAGGLATPLTCRPADEG